MTLVLHDVEVEGRRCDVRVADGVVAEVGIGLAAGSEEVVDGAGGALLPGLWDHHLHAVALAASLDSVTVGPPEVTDHEQLRRRLLAAHEQLPPGAWIRAVGYHESVAGDLDGAALDDLLRHRPVRLQHRGGAQWTLNGLAAAAVGLEGGDHPGIERGGGGVATGRIRGADDWLRARLPAGPTPDLAAVGALLASFGVVGITDATPYADLTDLDLLCGAARSGALPQRLVVTGGPELAAAPFPAGASVGPVKILLADHDLTGLDQLASWIARAHEAGRPVAVHCVTVAALALATAAWEQVGGFRPGDRIEHASVVTPELRARLAESPVTVVTQPNFVRERGDQYLADVSADERGLLYPCASLREAGIRVAGSTDAPFGRPDPWLAIQAAIERTSASGADVVATERVRPEVALELFLGRPDDPGGAPRRVTAGAPADLCLLDRPLADALRAPSEVTVRTTMVDGRVVHG